MRASEGERFWQRGSSKARAREREREREEGTKGTRETSPKNSRRRRRRWEKKTLKNSKQTEEGLPPLQAPPLFQASARGTLDYRAALLQLVDELLFGYAELLDCVARRPAAGSAAARAVEAVGAAARNASYLLNALRPRQARLGVAAAARRDAKEWNKQAEALERATREHDEGLLRHAAEVEKSVVNVE